MLQCPVKSEFYSQAGQLFVRRCITRLYSAAIDPTLAAGTVQRLEAAGALCGGLTAAFRAVMADQRLDAASKALVLSLPSASEVISLIPSCDPCTLHQVCEFLTVTLARDLRPEFEAVVIQFGSSSRCVRLHRMSYCHEQPSAQGGNSPSDTNLLLKLWAAGLLSTQCDSR